MNRVIKFRAWDENLKMMDNDFFIYADGNLFERASKSYDTPNTEIEQAYSLKLMQFTGINDINGVEVFEGDLVECNRSRIAQVKFLHGRFSVTIKSVYANRDMETLPISSFETLRVIGNIYQNPELLK